MESLNLPILTPEELDEIAIWVDTGTKARLSAFHAERHQWAIKLRNMATIMREEKL